MRLLAIGKTKFKYERKDGEVKTCKGSEDALDYAKENLKKGDIVRAKFDNGVIVRISKVKANTYSGKKNYDESNYQEMTEISVYKTVGTIVSGLKDVTTKNVVKVIDKLYKQGLGLVKSKKQTKTDDEFADTGSEEEFPIETPEEEFPEE